MDRFAKVFESYGRQFLIRKGENDDGDAELSITTVFEGAEMTVSIGFGDNDDAASKALQVFDQKAADVIGNKIEGCGNAFEVFKALSE